MPNDEITGYIYFSDFGIDYANYFSNKLAEIIDVRRFLKIASDTNCLFYLLILKHISRIGYFKMSIDKIFKISRVRGNRYKKKKKVLQKINLMISGIQDLSMKGKTMNFEISKAGEADMLIVTLT